MQREFFGGFAIAMDADCFGLQGSLGAFCIDDFVFFDHADNLLDCSIRVSDERIRLAARSECAVRLIRAVGKHFIGSAQADAVSGFDDFTAGQAEQNQFGSIL